MVWYPYKVPTVEWSDDSDLFRLKGNRVKETFYGPFARFVNVHINALSLDICPSYSELNYFAWGYGLSTPNPAKTFLKQSYEQFFRAPLEVGHRVAVVSGHQPGRVGKVVDVRFNVIAVEDEASHLVEEYTVDAVKRIFRIGDTVRVNSAVCLNHQKQEGWVIETQENEVTVVDADTNATVMC